MRTSWTAFRVAMLVIVITASGAGLGLAARAAQDEPLVFCSDLAFPPMEFLDGSTPVGADIDIAKAIGERLEREVEFTNIGFDGIIAALQSDICDAIISGMNNTPERAEVVDFVNYLNVGHSLVVQSGNPQGITSLETLCGHAAGAAQVGSTNLDTLNAASEACVAAGNEAIDISGFPADTDGILALQADRIDAYETDSPVAAYYIGQDAEAFEFGGPAIDALPVGIALRPDSAELRDQMQAAIDEMYADGTMAEILETWQLQDFALPDAAATPVASPPPASRAVIPAINVEWSIVAERIFSPDGEFWRALATTVSIAVVAQLLGIVLGLISALAGLSRLWPVRALSGLYVLVVRGTPLIVQIFFVFFGANLFFGFSLFPRQVSIAGLAVSGAILAGTVALAINEGAYMSEIIRAGIQAVDPGQMEAALSVGMTRSLAMRRIVLPQAARVIVPPLGNEFNGMIKNTSLLAFIGVYEMFFDAEVHYSTTFKPVEYFLAVAFWYLVLTTIWSLIQARIERRLNPAEQAAHEGVMERVRRMQLGRAR